MANAYGRAMRIILKKELQNLIFEVIYLDKTLIILLLFAKSLVSIFIIR